MKVYIFADLEGISGISGDAYVHGQFAAAGAAMMVEEINICADACFAFGATEVVVRDGHGSGVNFPASAVDRRVRLFQGASGMRRFPGIEGSGAMILLGYHAMAGASGAILEHTYSSKTIMNLYLNGEKIGEAGLDARIAGEYNVPVVMISGDDKTCLEAEKWLPGAVRCCVKQGLSCHAGLMFSREETEQRLRRAVLEALTAAPSIAPLRPETPVTLRWELVERCQAPAGPGVRAVDSRTYERCGNRLEEVFLG